MSISKYIKQYLTEAVDSKGKCGGDEDEIDETEAEFDGKTTKNKKVDKEANPKGKSIKEAKKLKGDQKSIDIDDDGDIEADDLADLRSGKKDDDVKGDKDIDETEAEFDGKTTKNKKVDKEAKPKGKSMKEATIVLPSDDALLALERVVDNSNSMIIGKVKEELVELGLYEAGDITELGIDLLESPEAEDKLKELGEISEGSDEDR